MTDVRPTSPPAKRVPVHLRTFLFLVPFSVLLITQKLLGFDVNLMAAPRPGMRDEAYFSLVTALALWTGSMGYFVHALKHGNESGAWLLVKVAVLVALHGIMIYLAEAGPE